MFETEPQLRTRYQHTKAYMKFIGVTEDEYVADLLKGRGLGDKADQTQSEEDVEADNAYYMDMIDKYNIPFESFINSKGITLEQFNTLPKKLQWVIEGYDTEFVHVMPDGTFQIGVIDPEGHISRDPRFAEDEPDNRETTEAGFDVDMVKHVVSTSIKDVANMTGLPEAPFTGLTVKEMESYFLAYQEHKQSMGEQPQLDAWQIMLGCVLGQAIINDFGGEWVMDVNDAPGAKKKYEEVAVSIGNSMFFPFTKAHKFIDSGLDESIYALYLAALNKFGPKK